MLKRIKERLLRIPLWLRVTVGIILILVIFWLLALGSFILLTAPYLASGLEDMAPKVYPCVDGTPGSPAVFTDLQMTLFTFPESASNIDSTCVAGQSVVVDVWFDMDASDSELGPFLDSMRWDVPPLTSTSEPPPFGNAQQNVTYLYGEFDQFPEGGSVWVDTEGAAYRVFVHIWLD